MLGCDRSLESMPSSSPAFPRVCGDRLPAPRVSVCPGSPEMTSDDATPTEGALSGLSCWVC